MPRMQVQAKPTIKVCRFNREPPWEEKHAAFLSYEANWPQAVEERGQSFLSAAHAPKFSSSVVLWVEEWLAPGYPQARLQQVQPCYRLAGASSQGPQRAEPSRRPAVCSS